MQLSKLLSVESAHRGHEESPGPHSSPELHEVAGVCVCVSRQIHEMALTQRLLLYGCEVFLPLALLLSLSFLCIDVPEPRSSPLGRQSQPSQEQLFWKT